MAEARKRRVLKTIAFVLALPVLAGLYEVWALTGVRTRPWQLESHMDSRLAECATGPGASGFRAENDRLAWRAQEARWSLLDVQRRFWLLRDYSSCVRECLSVCLDAQLLKLRIHQRRIEQRDRAAAMLAMLHRELGDSSRNGKIWAGFELRNLEENRARSLVRQADYLNERAEYQSALTTALRAWASWKRFSESSDLEFARFEDAGQVREWQRQVQSLLRWTQRTGRRAILVDKLEHRCLLLSRGRIEKSYYANLGRNWFRRKVREQDASTPEGDYRVKRMIRGGRYGMALLLDYPNGADRERFAALKRSGAISPQSRIGGNIEIHGGGRPDSDWTDGCVSLDDSDMGELYRYAYSGMPVSIVGSSGLIAAPQDRPSATR